MRTCLKNMKYLYFNNINKKFEYYVGNCYVENGNIVGFGLDDTNFDNVIDMTNKLVMPMFSNMNINLEEIIYRKLSGNWDPEKVSSLENYFGNILSERDFEYYEHLAPASLREVINSGTGLITTRRCWKTLSRAPIFSLAGYPITRNNLLKNYLNIEYINKISSTFKAPNVLQGFFLKGLASNDEGTLNFAKNNLSPSISFVAATIAQTELSKNIVFQKWQQKELEILENFGLLNRKTLLFGCNFLTTEELYKIKEHNATIVFTPVATKTLSVVPGNPIEAENLNIDWCLASGALSLSDSANMIYHMQETKKMFNTLSETAIIKAVCITPISVLKKITGIDISGQANFSVIDTNANFNDVNECIKWLFTVDPKTLRIQLMMNGNFISYGETDNLEEVKNYLRSFHKKFDTYLENPNMFVNEIPHKP